MISSRAASAALAALASLALTAATAQARPPGFAFLEIPSGARAAALGGAFASITDGTADAAFWNPAGLASIRGLEVSGAHTELIASLRHDTFAIGGPLWGGGAAASLRALYSEPIEERDDLGNLIGSFGSHDLELGVAYGWDFGPGLELGLSTQVVRERIANSSATTYAFGAGAAWEPGAWPGVRVAAALQNVGPAARYTIEGTRGEPVGLPSALQGGLSYGRAFGDRMTVRGALESRFTTGRSGIGLAGLEVRDLTGASLRAGLRVNDDASNFSVGAGFARTALELDYAFVPFRLDLGDTHRFAFTARF